MKILIVGNTSVVGRALAEQLQAKAAITMAGRRNASIPLDLTHFGNTDIEQTFDVVIHVAADFGGETDDDFIRAELVNAVGTLSVCRLARQVKARHIVIISTIFATYGPDDPYYGVYTLSKRHAEDVASFYCSQREIPLTILRPAQLYDAPSECRNHQRFLYRMIDQAEAGNDINIFGNHDARRNYLHLDDFVELCDRVIANRAVGTFACAHPRSTRLSEIAHAAFAAFGRGGQVRFLKDKSDIGDLPEVNDFRLYDIIGYSPAIDIESGISRIARLRRGD